MTLEWSTIGWDRVYDSQGIRRWIVRAAFHNISGSPLQITFPEDFLQQIRACGWVRYNGYSLQYNGPSGPFVAPVRLALFKQSNSLQMVDVPGYEVKFENQCLMHHLYGMPMLPSLDLTTTDQLMLIEVTGYDAGNTDDLFVALWGEAYDPSGVPSRAAQPVTVEMPVKLDAWPWNR